jgi:hypothetical protein
MAKVPRRSPNKYCRSTPFFLDRSQSVSSTFPSDRTVTTKVINQLPNNPLLSNQPPSNLLFNNQLPRRSLLSRQAPSKLDHSNPHNLFHLNLYL